MGKDVLGEFEHQVLLASLRLEPAAYSASIVRELETVIGRTISPAAVYIALRRLEGSSLVTSELRPGEEGGRARRYFVVTAAGVDMLRTSRSRFFQLWAGLEGVLGEGNGR